MKQKVDITELQEQHLDAMIGLAFDLDDAEDALRLSSEPDPVLTPQEQERADAVLQSVLARLDAREKAARQQRRSGAIKRWIPRMIEVAACLALVFAIAMPVAIANSAEFRSRVLRLLFEVDEEQGGMYFHFTEDPDAAFAVPEGWLGEYYPSYVPDGFSVWRVDEYMAAVEYRSADGNQLYIGEFGEGTGSTVGTDDAEIWYIDIQGFTAQVIDGNSETIHTVTITWANDTKFFMVAGNGVDTDVAIEVAQSVRKIVK